MTIEEIKCSRCGKIGDKKLFSSGPSALLFETFKGKSYCGSCIGPVKKDSSSHVILSTTPTLNGYRIEKYLAVESVEIVIGAGLFSEMSSEIADVFGTRSTVFETKLKVAKQQATDKIKIIAESLGGNAVVGIDLDYSEFNQSLIVVILSGTIVYAVKEYHSTEDELLSSM